MQNHLAILWKMQIIEPWAPKFWLEVWIQGQGAEFSSSEGILIFYRNSRAPKIWHSVSNKFQPIWTFLIYSNMSTEKKKKATQIDC